MVRLECGEATQPDGTQCRTDHAPAGGQDERRRASTWTWRHTGRENSGANGVKTCDNVCG